MSDLFAIRYDNETQTFRVSGELSLDSAAAAMTAAEDLFNSTAELDIDLAEVSRSDSAGLALLIAWMRQAKQSEKTISFRHLPAQMLAIAKASGLDEFLPLK
ncbi:STAS domain-containing protein [Methylophaga sp. OBS4]|uniref:STAS domain-containing protein n=1 Tax=Methylophaga sp. OBS4 TaxID=2991935 RepID=UPI00225C243B|nr:STAS domain-containing protein [Methylophaga sp. OBS4]MCX4187954.1 STAS domain-containing protein [Methylophaga sp. OBS4]